MWVFWRPSYDILKKGQASLIWGKRLGNLLQKLKNDQDFIMHYESTVVDRNNIFR